MLSRRELALEDALADLLAVDLDLGLGDVRIDEQVSDRLDELERDVEARAARELNWARRSVEAVARGVEAMRTRRQVALPRHRPDVLVVDLEVHLGVGAGGGHGEVTRQHLLLELAGDSRLVVALDLDRLGNRIEPRLGHRDLMRADVDAHRLDRRRAHVLAVDLDARVGLGDLDRDEPGQDGQIGERGLELLGLGWFERRPVELQELGVVAVGRGKVLQVAVALGDVAEHARARDGLVAG